mgnify:CR=1 FL=1
MGRALQQLNQLIDEVSYERDDRAGPGGGGVSARVTHADALGAGLEAAHKLPAAGAAHDALAVPPPCHLSDERSRGPAAPDGAAPVNAPESSV